MRRFQILLTAVVLMGLAVPTLAANPFSDVPPGHWGYDAVDQLASRGAVLGCGDGTFQGNRPMTRYEMASIVARTLAMIDMEKAEDRDVQVLKDLVMEFHDELSVLGVGVEGLDTRVAVLEENMGGWKMWGQFRMDAKFEDEAGNYGDTYVLKGDTEFDLSRMRLFMKKQINPDTYVLMRLDPKGGRGSDPMWSRYYVATKLPGNVRMEVGKLWVNWEQASQLYIDEAGFLGKRPRTGFSFFRDGGMADQSWFVAHYDPPSGKDVMEYGFRSNFNFNETFRLALNADLSDAEFDGGSDLNTYWVDFNFNIRPDTAFRGALFAQDIETPRTTSRSIDDPKLLKGILDVEQSALGFTSLWVEYDRIDAGFAFWKQFYNLCGNPKNNPYGTMAWDSYGASCMQNRNYDEDADVLFARLEQRWNDRWSSFERYFLADFNTPGLDDTTNWTLGVSFRYRPGLTFELSYDHIDWGDSDGSVEYYGGTASSGGKGSAKTGDDGIIRLRTFLCF